MYVLGVQFWGRNFLHTTYKGIIDAVVVHYWGRGRYSYSLLWCYQACSMNSVLRRRQNANPIDRAGENEES